MQSDPSTYALVKILEAYSVTWVEACFSLTRSHIPRWTLCAALPKRTSKVGTSAELFHVHLLQRLGSQYFVLVRVWGWNGFEVRVCRVWGYQANSNILPKYLIPQCFFLSEKKQETQFFLNNSAVWDTGFRKKNTLIE